MFFVNSKFQGELRAHAERNNVCGDPRDLCPLGELPDRKGGGGAGRPPSADAGRIQQAAADSVRQAGAH